MKLSKEPYKGTRDLYPREYFVQHHMFSLWSKVAHGFGYEYYDAPMLEETALYAAKSGDELVGEQTYSFTDRGGREVTIRPELTPSFARMVAKKQRELPLPIRWFSIPNVYRYEKPQRGRLREHWQLNVDIAGVTDIRAERELILLTDRILKEAGAQRDMYEVRLNSRRLVSGFFSDVLGLSALQAKQLSRLMDKMNKMPEKEFWVLVEELLDAESRSYFEVYMNAKTLDDLQNLPDTFLSTNAGIPELRELFALLELSGVTNVVFDPTLMRGLDYYTGVIFEMFDLHPENRKAICGGGRYDDLVGIFGAEAVTCVGFGMGDVRFADFLASHGLLPAYCPSAELLICIQDTSCAEYAHDLAMDLREQGLNVIEEIQDRKVKAQMKFADRIEVPFTLCIGLEEKEIERYSVKNMVSGEATDIAREDLFKKLKENMSNM